MIFIDILLFLMRPFAIKYDEAYDCLEDVRRKLNAPL